jgi:alpha-1,3-mannosyltransferase
VRVVQVTRQFFPAIGGLEEAVLRLAKQLKHRHHIEIEILTLDRVFSEPHRRLPETDLVDGMTVARIPYWGSRRYPIAPKVVSSIRSADLVHVHGVDFFFDFLAWTAPYHRKPLVASTHGGFFHTKFARHMKGVYFRTGTAYSCRAYTQILATSESDAKIFRKIAAEKVAVIPNGVDTEKWADCSSSHLKPCLIYFGRLSTNKRVHLWFPVLKELRRSGDWKLIIAGRADDVTFDSLEQVASRHEVRDAVSFVSSPSSRQLGQLIAEASYYVSASEHEGFGISAVEAMSAGLVPVLSPIPAFKGLIQGAPGLILDPEKPTAAANLIQQLHWENTGSVEAIRRRLRSAALTYDWRSASDLTAAVYRKILGAP